MVVWWFAGIGILAGLLTLLILIWRKKKKNGNKKQVLEEINAELEDIIRDLTLKEREIDKVIEEGDGGFREAFTRSRETRQKPRDNNRKYDRVLKLVKEGKEVEQIAEELNLGIRETELIVKLSRGGENHDQRTLYSGFRYAGDRQRT